ncbi:MAG: hypothetical protein AB8B46_05785 [Candidatus Midichloriaceae bacterium]
MIIKNIKAAALLVIALSAVNNTSNAAGGESASSSGINHHSPYTEKNAKKFSKVDWPDPSSLYLDGFTSVNFGGVDLKSETKMYDMLKTNAELDKSELDFNYIMGLYLEFGRGNITIEKARDVAKTKVELLKSRVKEFQEKQQENNDKKGYQEVGNKEILEAVMLNMWSKIEQKISEDIDMLNKNGKEEIVIQKLQNEYKESAIKWFSGQYGVGIKYKKQIKKE